MKNLNLILLLSFLIVGCSTNIPTINERKANALSLIDNSYKETINQTKNFNLFSIQKNLTNCKNNNLNIYIEGDGLSWVSKNKISENPTPINPISLKLMLKDNNDCKIYFGRPFQFINSNESDNKYWTNYRFNQIIIDSYNELINNIKLQYSINKINIIGYSGGGSISTIIASERNDINKLITIAGNLDIDKWVEINNISKLDGSINPINRLNKLNNIKQIHFIGLNDNIVSNEVFYSFYNKSNDKKNIEYFKIEATHNDNWENLINLNNYLN